MQTPTNLLVCAFPADEVTIFGNAVLADQNARWTAVLMSADPVGSASYSAASERWRAACRSMGIEPLEDFEFSMPVRAPRVDRRSVIDACSRDLAQRIEPFLRDATKIYVPDIQSVQRIRKLACLAAIRVANTVFMESPRGCGTEFCPLDARQLETAMGTLNAFYRDRFQAKQPAGVELWGTRQYRKLSASSLRSFFLPLVERGVFETIDEDPCGISTSEYEAERQMLELQTLQSLPWSTFIEVGACTGVFTEKLCNAFSDRQIIAYEPDPAFCEKLRQRVGSRAKVYQRSAQEAQGPCDVLLISAVLYYMDSFPTTILNIGSRYIVLSHPAAFHTEVVVPVLKSAGWVLEECRELLPRMELSCEIPILKEGTEVAVWRAPS